MPELILLFILPMPIASIAWTLTHEELFRELRDWCARKGQSCDTVAKRKFFYILTCEYCLSHYVALVIVAITRYHPFYEDWRGYLVGFFSLVWIANIYMSFYGRVRLDIRRERVQIAAQQKDVEATPQSRPIQAA